MTQFPASVLILAAADEFPDALAGWQIVMPVVMKKTSQEVFQESILILPMTKRHKLPILDLFVIFRILIYTRPIPISSAQ